VIGIEREAFLGPIRQDLDQLAACQLPIETELKSLRYAVTGRAGTAAMICGWRR
jgi:hypothetical protein